MSNNVLGVFLNMDAYVGLWFPSMTCYLRQGELEVSVGAILGGNVLIILTTLVTGFLLGTICGWFES